MTFLTIMVSYNYVYHLITVHAHADTGYRTEDVYSVQVISICSISADLSMQTQMYVNTNFLESNRNHNSEEWLCVTVLQI